LLTGSLAPSDSATWVAEETFSPMASALAPLMRHDGEIAAEAVRDGDSLAFGQGHWCALRDERDFNFASECYLIVWHGMSDGESESAPFLILIHSATSED
jgi:hypothetical protein